MGRSGGGGGGHSSSGHGSSSHHGSSHHGSGGSGGFRSSGSSFHSGPSHSGGSGFGNGPRRSGGPGFGGPGGGPGFGGPGGGPGFGGPGGPRRQSPPPPPPRHYGAPPPPPRRRGSAANGCATIMLIAIILIIYAFMALVRGASGSANVSDNNISEYAEEQYSSIFNGREDCLLIVLDENDDGQIKYGAKANYIMDSYVEDMWDNYDKNYNNDLGIQLGNMFTDTANQILADNVSAITPDKSFDSHCYRDDLNWVDTKSNLESGAEYFYEATGIQAYVLLVKAKTISKATNKSSGVLKVLIIACAAVIIVCIGFNWWKKKIAQKNKEQEDLERTLKTPLETFGTTGTISDLEKKYDDSSTDNTSQ